MTFSFAPTIRQAFAVAILAVAVGLYSCQDMQDRALILAGAAAALRTARTRRAVPARRVLAPVRAHAGHAQADQ